MREFLYKIKHFIKLIIKFFKRNIPQKLYRVAKSDSYYPELNRKFFIHRYLDMLKWYIKYNEISDFYNLYGLDVVGKDAINNNFINYWGRDCFAVSRDQRNNNNLTTIKEILCH